MRGTRVLGLFLVFAAVSAFAPGALAQEFKTIFNGITAPEVRVRRQIIAVAVSSPVRVSPLIRELRQYAGPNMTLLAYSDHENVSETEPVVVFVDGALESFRDRPRSSAVPPTIAESTSMATSVERGERVGAICADGIRTTATHAGACSLHRGVDQWLYSAVATTRGDVVIATICSDYRLVSGTGGRCGRAGILAQLKPFAYAAPIAVPEPQQEPESPVYRRVAPLPGPSVQIPTITDSSVEWTERQNGDIGFTWAASVANPNVETVRAMVSLNLRAADGEIIQSAEHAVTIDGGATVEFSDQGAVAEQEALAADRWTFDVSLLTDDHDAEESALDELAPSDVEISVDLQRDEVRLNQHRRPAS